MTGGVLDHGTYEEDDLVTREAQEGPLGAKETCAKVPENGEHESYNER